MPRCLGAVGFGAGEQEEPVRGVRGGGPDLLPVDHVVVAVAARAGGERGEVRAGPRLGEALRPRHLAGEDARQVLAALLLGAVEDQRRPQHVGAGAADRRGAGARQLLLEDELLHRAEPAAAVLLRPVRRDPVVLGERVRPGDGGLAARGILGLAIELPRPLEAMRGDAAAAVARREALGDQAADLLAKVLLLLVVAPVHCSLPPCSRPGRPVQSRAVRSRPMR